MNNVTHLDELRQHRPSVDLLALELRVFDRAAGAAMSLGKSKSTDEMDDAQAKVVMHCLQRLREAKATAVTILERERHARADYASVNPIGRLRDRLHSFESAVQHATFGRRAELGNAFDRFSELRMKLWKMKKEKNYQREPHPQGNVQMAVALLFFAMVFETLVNGILFAGGSEMGYVGGIAQALFISLVNLILSFGTGFLLKVKNSLKGWRKYVVVGALFSVQQCIIGLVNLSAAHYRSAVAVLESYEAANRQFLSRVFSHPLQLESFESFVLLVFGFIIAQYMLYKGYTFGDEDREYGKLGTELVEAEKAYDELKLNVEVDIKLARQDADRDVATDVTEYSRKISLYKSSLAMSRAISEEFGRIASEWNEAQKVLLKQFRRLLGDAPLTCPLPTYWNSFNSFPEGEMHLPLDLSEDEATLARMVPLEVVVERAEEIKQIVHVRELEESRSLESFFDSIERRREAAAALSGKELAMEVPAGADGEGGEMQLGADADKALSEVKETLFGKGNGNGTFEDSEVQYAQTERV